MKKLITLHRLLCISFLSLISALLFSCKNDVKEVAKVTKVDSLPAQSAQKIRVDYSENGKLVYTLSSPLIRKYIVPQEVTEFPKGFNLVFYDTLRNQKGTGRANYGISHDNTGIVELIGNVVMVNNQKKMRIETEKMIWNKNQKTVAGDKAVRVYLPDRMVYGTGFNATEDLSKWSLVHPGGTFLVNEFR
jgi:LPS export ABC transporter protein LptC